MSARTLGSVAVVVALLAACDAGPSAHVELTVRPVKLLADGRTTAEMFATVTDPGGVPIAGAAVAFEAAGATIAVDAGALTDDTGKARATVRGTSPGALTVRATALGEHADQELALVALAAPCPVGNLYNAATADVGGPQVADVDQDGRPDLVGVNQMAGVDSIRIALGNGDGTFGWPTELDHPGVLAIAMGDVDGDALADLVVRGYMAPELSLRRGLGNGSFGDPVAIALTFPEPNTPISLVNVDGDGALDLLARGHDDLYLAYGGGGASFEPFVAAPFSGQMVQSLATQDLDQDGRTDLVATSFLALHVILGRADRALAETSYPVASGVGGPVVIAELTGDAFLDVVAGGGLIFPGLGGGGLDDLEIGAPPAMVAGDMNGDGATDLIGAGAGGLQVHLRTGPTTFAAQDSVPVGEYASALAVADYTGEGHADVLVGTGSRSVVIAGDGMGGLAGRPRFEYSAQTVAEVLVTDLDLDGAPDIVDRTHAFATDIRIHRAFEGGGFEPWFPYPAALHSMIAADVDRDGHVDLVALADAASTAPRHVEVALGLPGVQLAAGQLLEVVAPGGMTTGLAAGDFDADGRLDLIVGTTLVAPGYAVELAFLRGNGDGTFGAPQPFSFVEDVRGFVVGDFDHDAHLDVAVAAETTRLYRGNGDGTFAPPVAHGPVDYAGEIFAGDLDGDGFAEAITTRYWHEPFFTVIPGTTGQAVTYPGELLDDTRLADVDRDGALDLVTKGGGVLTVIPGDGEGGFLPPRTFHAFPGPDDMLDAMAIDDLDLDGRLDVVSRGVIYPQTCQP